MTSTLTVPSASARRRARHRSERRRGARDRQKVPQSLSRGSESDGAALTAKQHAPAECLSEHGPSRTIGRDPGQDQWSAHRARFLKAAREGTLIREHESTRFSERTRAEKLESLNGALAVHRERDAGHKATALAAHHDSNIVQLVQRQSSTQEPLVPQERILLATRQSVPLSARLNELIERLSHAHNHAAGFTE